MSELSRDAKAELRVIRRERNRLWKRYGSMVREGFYALPAEVLRGIKTLNEREATILGGKP